MSTDADDIGSFLCAHGPYFTLIPEPDIDTELLTVTQNEFQEAFNDTFAKNDGFVAPNYSQISETKDFLNNCLSRESVC